MNTTSKVPSGELNIVVRHTVRGLALLSAGVAFLGTSDSPLSPWWGLFFGATAILLAWYATGPSARLMAPIAFSVFYSLGYVAAFGALAALPSDAESSGFGSVGAFNFTDEEMLQPTAEILGGLTGLAVLALFGRHVKQSGIRAVAHTKVPISGLIIFWSVLAVIAVGVCAATGLGRVGLTPTTTLPFGLGGLVVYMRNLLVPCLAVYILERSAISNAPVSAWVMLALSFVFSIVGAISSLSRSFVVVGMLPVAIQFFDKEARFKAIRRFGWVVLGVIIIAFTLIIGTITSLRGMAYTGGGAVGVSDTVQTVNVKRDSSNLRAELEHIVTLSTARVGGIREHLALACSRTKGFDAVIGAALSDSDITERITEDAYGFRPIQNETLSTGIGFGFWGQLSLAHSVLLMFLATVTCGGLVMSLEWLFSRLGAVNVGRIIGIILALHVWTQPTWFTFSRALFVVLLALMLIAWLRVREARAGSRLVLPSNSY